MFCVGIFAAALYPFLVRVFYSFQDTKTPVAVGLSCMVLNVALAFLFVHFLGYANFFRQGTVSLFSLQGTGNIVVVGLPLGFALSQIVQFFLLFALLKRKLGDINLPEIKDSFEKVILATFLMALFVYFVIYFLSGVFLQLVAGGVAAVLVYILITYFLKSPELKTVKHSLLKQFKGQ